MKKTYPTILGSIAAICIFSLGTPTSSAQLIALEQFDYATGNLAGQNGGSGWEGAWTTGTSTNLSQVVASPGLTYAGLPTLGNASSDNSFSTMFGTRPFNATGITSDSGTIWFSFLFHTPTVTGNAGVNRVRLFGNANGGADTGAGVDINADGTVKVAIRNNQPDGNSPGGALVNYNLDTTYLGLVRIIMSSSNNSDEVSFWLNPALDATLATLGAPNSVHSANVQLSGPGTNGGSFMIRGDGAYHGFVDELRVGWDLNAVLVPEPGTFGLLACGFALLAARRRRSAS